MTFRQVTATIVASLLSCAGQSQTIARSSDIMPALSIYRLGIDSVPDEVRNSIPSPKTITEILQIRNIEKVTGQTLIIDELIIQPNATIEFTGKYPWVLLYASRIRIVKPDSLITIRRDSSLSPVPGAAGLPGGQGTDGHTPGKHGTEGTSGLAGTNGQIGQTTRVPDLYIVAGRIEASNSSDPLASARLLIDLRGVPGGVGGDGGVGGVGGRGGGGKKGQANMGICSAGPGNGGNGGSGGSGGNGASGATGGSGGSVILIGTPAALDVISAAEIFTDGGAGGKGGKAGLGGAGQAGGDRGSKPGACSGGSNGNQGSAGPAGAPGSIGETGKRGKITAISIASLEALPHAAASPSANTLP